MAPTVAPAVDSRNCLRVTDMVFSSLAVFIERPQADRSNRRCVNYTLVVGFRASSSCRCAISQMGAVEGVIGVLGLGLMGSGV